MSLPVRYRYLALALTLLFSFHYLAAYSSTRYAQGVERVRGTWATPLPIDDRPNAAFVVLCQNKDLGQILMSMQSLESTFNAKSRNQYPYVFLNDAEFTPRFKARIRAATKSDVQFGRVEGEVWDMPSSINATKAALTWAKAAKGHMPYGASQSYRQMCRFQSGYFYKHPLVQPFKYYWRVEPNVRFFCDLEHFDPFRHMRDHNLKYGFTLALHEIPATVRTLWIRVREWYTANPHFLHPHNAFPFVAKDNGVAYTLCHFWSNFEIADLDFFRSQAYQSLFDFLDAKGGFFYERWGDAPVHSIAASLLLDKNEIHHFDNIGYMHPPFMHCPKDSPEKAGRCFCTHETSLIYDDKGWSCMYQWDEINGRNSTANRLEWLKLDP